MKEKQRMNGNVKEIVIKEQKKEERIQNKKKQKEGGERKNNKKTEKTLNKKKKICEEGVQNAENTEKFHHKILAIIYISNVYILDIYNVYILQIKINVICLIIYKDIIYNTIHNE